MTRPSWAAFAAMSLTYFASTGFLLEAVGNDAFPLVVSGLLICLCVLRFSAIAGFCDVLAVLVAAQVLHAVNFAAQHAACTVQLGVLFPGRLRGRGQALCSCLGCAPADPMALAAAARAARPAGQAHAPGGPLVYGQPAPHTPEPASPPRAAGGLLPTGRPRWRRHWSSLRYRFLGAPERALLWLLRHRCASLG